MTARNETVTIGRGAVRTLVRVIVAWQIGVAANGHSGRRFQIGIENGKLIAQGAITTGVDDGGGVVRPYTNVLHDHWSNSPLIGFERASSTLPGFDVLGPAPSELRFQSLSLELKSASQWLAPPSMIGPGTTPSLVPLGGDQELSMTLGGQSVFPGDGQSLLLDPSIDPGGSLDIDPLYAINETPVDKLIVLELELTTSAPGVFRSDPIYVVLSPDGDSPAARLHHTSLFLEDWLASRNIPEPNTAVLVVIGAALSNWGFRSRSRITQSDKQRE